MVCGVEVGLSHICRIKTISVSDTGCPSGGAERVGVLAHCRETSVIRKPPGPFSAVFTET